MVLPSVGVKKDILTYLVKVQLMVVQQGDAMRDLNKQLQTDLDLRGQSILPDKLFQQEILANPILVVPMLNVV